MTQIDIYTDGSVSGNQFKKNRGGWGVFINYSSGLIRTLNGFSNNTTNSRMEMTAVLKALEFVNEYCFSDDFINIYSDSAFIVNTFKNTWYKSWLNKNWKNSKNKPVKNSDLWKKILSLINNFNNINFIKVFAHSGIPGNEIADALATGKDFNLNNICCL